MSEDLFANPYSPIPDALWTTPSPRERQLAAVEYWADLTRSEKVAAASTARARFRDFLAKDNVAEALSAGILAPSAAATSLYLSGNRKGNDGVRSSKTREQEVLAVARAALEEKKRQGTASKTSERMQKLKERMAEIRANNPKSVAAGSAGAAGISAALLTRYFKGRP